MLIYSIMHFIFYENSLIIFTDDFPAFSSDNLHLKIPLLQATQKYNGNECAEMEQNAVYEASMHPTDALKLIDLE